MASLTSVELICTCLAAAAAIVLVAGTFASKNAYDLDGCDSECALFLGNQSCSKKGVCDLTIFAGFASMGVGLLCIAQIIVVLIHERPIADPDGGRLSRLRCLTFPKLMAAALCVLGLLGIAIMVSVGVATYCNTIESTWKKNTGAAFPGCRAFDSKACHGTDWPCNGFLTMEVMVGGAWASFLLWVFVLAINIITYIQRMKAASFGFKEMQDTETSS